MESNGGDADAETAGGVLPLTCLTCHGEGAVADPFDTHELIRFRELPVDPNE